MVRVRMIIKILSPRTYTLVVLKFKTMQGQLFKTNSNLYIGCIEMGYTKILNYLSPPRTYTLVVLKFLKDTFLTISPFARTYTLVVLK